VEAALVFSLVASLCHWHTPLALIPGGLAALVSFVTFRSRTPWTLWVTTILVATAASIGLAVIGILPDPDWFSGLRREEA
jgi:hypothetical protein